MYRRGYKRTGTKAKNNTDLPFVVHSVNETRNLPAWWGKWEQPIRIVSIDPGITHFCLRIEERTGDSFKTIKLIKTNLGDRSALAKKSVSNDMKLGTLMKLEAVKTDEFAGRDVCHKCEHYIGVPGGCDCDRLSDTCKYKKAFDEPMRVYGRLTKLLDSIKEELVQCDLVIVESQLKINYKMTRFGQHILSYFTSLALSSPAQFLIVEVDPKLKSTLASKKPDDVKKWAVEYARELATKCDDTEGLKLLNMRGKTNDFADTLVQIEGFLRFVK